LNRNFRLAITTAARFRFAAFERSTELIAGSATPASSAGILTVVQRPTLN
jgi:hypothetical protein